MRRRADETYARYRIKVRYYLIKNLLRQLLTRVTSPKISGELREHFAQLKAVVEEFNERFPDIAKQNGSSKSLSWKSLQQNVLRLKNQHEAKSQGGFVGSSKKGFHGVCATINDHLSLLKILPQGEKFTAPICGSVEIIVKVIILPKSIVFPCK